MSKDFLGNEWPSSCMGCLIYQEEMEPPGGILYKSKHFHINQDPLIPMQGFLVIGSNRHIQKITEMTKEEYIDYCSLFKITRDAIQLIFNVPYITTIQEEHSVHFHTWFFPWSVELLNLYPKPSLAYVRTIMNEFLGQTITKEQWGSLKMKLAQVKKLITKYA